MERRIWLYLLEHEVLKLKFIGKVDILDEERYAAFRKRLEEFKVVDWAFDF
jgi:hypothetical protein